jgi:uncharacterized protein (TIGR02118 family)
MKNGMIKVSVFYPNGDGKKFDMTYYLNTHVPLVSATLGDALINASYDKGLAGGQPGSSAPFVAIANLYFNSMEAFGQAFAGGAPILMADLPNFTDIEPVIQINEVIA